MHKKILLLFLIISSCGLTLFGQNDTQVIKQDRMPAFPGGELAMMKFVADNIHQTEAAKKKGISGSIPIVFNVDSTGQMQNIHIKEGGELGYGLDEEAMRVMTLMSENYVWSPGIHNGRKVSVTFTLPVKFINQQQNE